jgi:hypothetical protein
VEEKGKSSEERVCKGRDIKEFEKKRNVRRLK